MEVSSPKVARMPSSCCCRMLRPSSSGVSGLGSARPRRVPFPAARITTCSGSVVNTGSSEGARRGRRRGEGRGGEEQVEHAVGGVPVVVGAEGPPERREPIGVRRRDRLQVAERGQHLVARGQQGTGGDLLEVEV